MDGRYNSGTSLNRTAKEIVLDRIESRLGDFTDDVYVDMKKLTLSTLRLIESRLP